MVCYGMSGHGILKLFYTILDKKDPPEDKELYSISLGHYRKLYQLSLIATEAYNAEVTKMLKHAKWKWSVTKNS